MNLRTNWTQLSLDRYASHNGLANASEAVLAICREYGKETNVKWDWVSAGGGVTVMPVDDGISPVSRDELAEDTIRDSYETVKDSVTGFASYWDVYLDNPLISLPDIMRCVRTMEKYSMARRTVNRSGKGYAFKLT